MKGLNKQEVKYIFYSLIFAFVVFAIAIPLVLKNNWISNPFLQFGIFNLGIFFTFQIFLKAVSTDGKAKIKNTLGILILFMIGDIWSPPIMVSPAGVLNQTVLLGASSTDYIFALLWQSVGITQFMLYIFTYVVTPLILLVISALLLKNMVNEI